MKGNENKSSGPEKEERSDKLFARGKGRKLLRGSLTDN